MKTTTTTTDSSSPTPRFLPGATPTRTAFSLIELLIVTAIVATLAGITLPAVSMVLRSAHLTHCSHNLQEVGKTAWMYHADHGQFPAEGNKGDRNPATSPAWFHRLPVYADGITLTQKNSVFQCPVYGWHGGDLFDHASPKSYKMNGYLDADGRPHHYMAGTAIDQGDIMFFITAKAGETGVGQWGHCTYNGVEASYHHGKANMLMLDGRTTQTAQRTGDQEWRDLIPWRSVGW